MGQSITCVFEVGMEEEDHCLKSLIFSSNFIFLKCIYSLLVLIGWSLTAISQIHVEGIVTRSSDGKPLSGASVYFEHTTVGTVTDSSGAFSLSVTARGPRQLIVSYIGFQRHVENIGAGTAERFFNIKLDKKETTLQEVVVKADDGWRKWGTLFTDLFIGTSAYAKHCTILNKEKLRFVYAKATNTLHVYADEPLMLENQSLGYSIRIDMEKFSYELNTKYLFYEIHSFYQQLRAESIGDLKKWEKNRLDVYKGSTMHFYRSLFDSSFIKQGFKVYRMIAPDLSEWERISVLYHQYAGNTNDFEKSVNKDSLKYYHKILKQGPDNETIDTDSLQFHEFASKQDSATISLNFNGRLLVMYTGKDAPYEYLVATGVVAAPGQPVRQTNPVLLRENSFLELTDHLPIEVYKTGAIKNDDLLTTGYFAWLNKMATSLPFDYNPQEVLLKTGNR